MAPLLAGDRFMRLSPDGGRTFPKWWDGSGRRRRQVALSTQLPNEPASVSVYDEAAGTGHKLCLDFDVSKAKLLAWVSDPVDKVTLDAAACSALLERCGFEPIADRSPTGGRHLYVRIAQPLPWTELRDTVRALAQRFPTIDPSPHLHAGGQIRIPGSGHKLQYGQLTGWMTLTTPLSEAVAAAWNTLQGDLTAEYAAIGLDSLTLASAAARAGVDAVLDDLADLPRDDDGAPWLPRLGGVRPPNELYAQIAVSGAHDYPSGSEACWRVLWSCARRGWQLADIRARIDSGEWSGLWDLYGHRRRSPYARARALEADWRRTLQKILAQNRQEDPGRKGDTSPRTTRAPLWGATESDSVSAAEDQSGQVEGTERTSQPPVRSKGGMVLNEWQLIAQFQNAAWAAERDPTERQAWGRQALSIRRVLRALLIASRLVGSTTTGFGIRHLALAAKMNEKTVAKVLKRLRDEPDPWVDHTEVHHWDQPDRYTLRLPDRYREIAVWRRWRAGLIPSIHPIFRQLSSPCAFVYEALDEVEPTLPGQLATSAALSASATTDALRELATHGLAIRVPARGTDDLGGWVRGPVTLDAAGLALNVEAIETAIKKRYIEERETFRKQLTDFEASFHGATAPDPDAGAAAELADFLAQQEPPAERIGSAEHLPMQIPAAIEGEQASTAAMPLSDCTGNSEAKPQGAIAEYIRGENTARQANRPPANADSTPPAPPLPPPRPAPLSVEKVAEPLDKTPSLQLLIDKLGAVVLSDMDHQSHSSGPAP
jgi:hypothetical protein